MNCKDYQKLIYEYIDRALSHHIEKEISDHLKACEECRELYEKELNFSEFLKNAMDHKTSSLEIDQSMMVRLKDEKKEKKRQVFSWKWADLTPRPITLLIVVLIIFLSVLVIHSPESVDDKMSWMNDKFGVFGLEEDLMLSDPKADWLERRMIFTIVDEKQKRLGKIITSKNPEKTIMYWEKMEAKQ